MCFVPRKPLPIQSRKRTEVEMWGWLGSLFNALLRKLKAFLKKVWIILQKEGAALILDIVRQTVLELSKTDLSNEDKRKEAFSKISAYALNKGIVVRDSLIFTLIELCVQELKSIERGDG